MMFPAQVKPQCLRFRKMFLNQFFETPGNHEFGQAQHDQTSFA